MRVLKTILFHILMTFRRPVLWVLRVFGGLLVISSIFLLFAGKEIGLMPKIMTFVFGIGLGAAAFYYDQLLLKIQPEGANIVLFQ
jgi:hypothetical protein